MRTFLHTIAVVLAFMGQWAVALGMPILRPTTPSDDCAACGCCPTDKEARVCCCFPTPVVPIKPAPNPTCCHAESAKPKHSCCVEEEEVPPPEPVRWHWVGGVLTKQCRGFVASGAVIGVVPAIPPALPVDRWSPSPATFAPPTAEQAHPRAEQPPAPPPRDRTPTMSASCLSWETSMRFKVGEVTRAAFGRGC